MKTKTIVFALIAVTAGVFAWTRPHNAPPSDFRDAVSDNSFDALKNSAGAEASAVSVPEPKIKPFPAVTGSRTEKVFSRHSNPVMEACRGGSSCSMAFDGRERGFCEAYKEDKSCFMALDGADRGWCQVMKEGKSCFMALDGADRDLCEKGRFPRKHMFWARCANISLPHGQSDPLMQACHGEKSCFTSLNGPERGLCEAYTEGKSCFMVLDGADRGWCQVMKEGKSCSMSLDGEDRDRCEKGYYPGNHLFWEHCGK